MAKYDLGRALIEKEPWWSKRASNISSSLQRTGKIISQGFGEAREREKLYKGNKLDDTYAALTNLLKVADSEDGMKIYNKKLDEFRLETIKFGEEDNIIQADMLQLIGNQKKQMHSDFTTSIQDASDFINTTQFLDQPDEFVNIQDTIDRINVDLKAEGKTEHGSVADFLQSELSNANRLRDGMVAGFKIQGDEIVGTNFRYNKAETNDKETYRQLNLYRDRLELATKSLAGDKMISPEEAEAIMIGDKEHYFQVRGEALRKAEFNYKANKSMSVKYDGLINTALQKKLSADDILSMEELDDAGKLEMGRNFTSGSWDKIVQQLTNKKGEYTELRNIANDNYKNWYGSYFEEVKGGMTEEEINAFNLKVQQEQEELEKKKKLEEEKKLEKTKQRYVEPVEEKKTQTYSIDEKDDAESLLTDYIGGNVSDEVLKNIGGQNLLNRARVMKNAYKGQKPKATVIPFVKTKGVTPVDMETLKGSKFKNPGKSGKFSWDDITGEIHSSGKLKTEKGSSIANKYLLGEVNIDDLNVRWRSKRDAIKALKKKYKSFGISPEEFKERYRKDYEKLVNLLAQSRTK